MKIAAFVVVAVLSLTVFSPARADTPAACPLALAQKSLCASITWTTQPSDDDFSAFTLRFWNPAQGTSAGPYLSPAEELHVNLFMPSMGHGSSPVKIAPAKDLHGQVIPGTYQVSEVYFTMHGEWEIQLELRKDGKPVDRAKLGYKF